MERLITDGGIVFKVNDQQVCEIISGEFKYVPMTVHKEGTGELTYTLVEDNINHKVKDWYIIFGDIKLLCNRDRLNNVPQIVSLLTAYNARIITPLKTILDKDDFYSPADSAVEYINTGDDAADMQKYLDACIAYNDALITMWSK
jgi:hypothetical protein